MTFRKKYNGVAIALHWSIALLIIGLLSLGWYMTDLPKDDPARMTLYMLHKSFGLITLVLVALRVVWRLGHTPPPPPDMPRWQRAAATAGHHLLYLGMVVMPLSGFLNSSFGKGIVFFGMPLPCLFLPNHALGHFFGAIHTSVDVMLAVVIGAHVLGALSHLVARDGVFSRMLPGK